MYGLLLKYVGGIVQSIETSHWHSLRRIITITGKLFMFNNAKAANNDK